MTDTNEELIELVRANKELYDKSDEQYKNVKRKADIWRDIALTLNYESGKKKLISRI